MARRKTQKEEVVRLVDRFNTDVQDILATNTQDEARILASRAIRHKKDMTILMAKQKRRRNGNS